MIVDSRLLEKMGVSPDRAARFAPEFATALPAQGIDTPLRVAHFLAQILHESGMCRATSENLNYSADALQAVFAKYFPTRDLAEAYERQPERIGARVYADRMGNGDEAGGEGYHYRGRGLIQLTGKDNYRAFSTWIGSDVVDDPTRVADVYPVASAVYFWTRENLNAKADRDDLDAVTRAVNGGLNGLAHRRELLDKAKALLGPAADAGADDTAADLYRVTASTLNLRRSAAIRDDNVVASLNQGTEVQPLGAADADGWIRVQVRNGGPQGYVAMRYLRMA